MMESPAAEARISRNRRAVTSLFRGGHLISIA
jgi:hypothetical protein